MTLGGWINLILSVGFVTSLFIYCLVRVLRRPAKDHALAHVEPIERDETDAR
jgi:hypothetical protein